MVRSASANRAAIRPSVTTPETAAAWVGCFMHGMLCHAGDMVQVATVHMSKRAPTLGRPGRVNRSSPRREMRGADPVLRQRSAPKHKRPARGRPLVCLSGCGGAGGCLSAAARIATIGRAQNPPNPPAGGPEWITCGPSLWRQCRSCAVGVACSELGWCQGTCRRSVCQRGIRRAEAVEASPRNWRIKLSVEIQQQFPARRVPVTRARGD
jgi:hypothetical protein